MLYFDRIDVPEGIDIDKASASEECDICHYCRCGSRMFRMDGSRL